MLLIFGYLPTYEYCVDAMKAVRDITIKIYPKDHADASFFIDIILQTNLTSQIYRRRWYPFLRSQCLPECLRTYSICMHLHELCPVF